MNCHQRVRGDNLKAHAQCNGDLPVCFGRWDDAAHGKPETKVTNAKSIIECQLPQQNARDPCASAANVPARTRSTVRTWT